MNDTELDLLLSTLAHSGRRRMLDLVTGTPGMSVKALASHFDISRIAVLKHVQLLEEAGLIISRKEGRTRHLFFNPVPIQQIQDRWSNQYAAFWSGRLADVKARVEASVERKRNQSA